MKGFLIILIGLCLLLAVTNPDKENFLEWVHVRIEKEADSSMDAMVRHMVTKPLLQSSTVRKDYIFFSVFIVDEIVSEKYIVLGILNQFIKITDEDIVDIVSG